MVQAPLTPEKIIQHIPGLVKVEPCFDRGGFKAVYRAVVEGKEEALKVIRIQQLDDPIADPDLAGAIIGEQISRVRREVDALKKCQVPELVKLGSIRLTDFEIEGEKYVAYSEEFLKGDDLWKLIKMSTRPDLKELVSLFQTLLRCIKELWHHGFVHRDIKPANVIKISDPNRPFVLLDLGIAYAVQEASITFKMDGRLPPATYRYLAPEMMQQDFRDRLDFRADLYTTGLTVFEYAAGQHPLARNQDDLIQTITRALRQPPTPLKRYRSDLPDSFCDSVDCLLRKKPSLRPANLDMLLKKLEVIA